MFDTHSPYLLFYCGFYFFLLRKISFYFQFFVVVADNNFQKTTRKQSQMASENRAGRNRFCKSVTQRNNSSLKKIGAAPENLMSFVVMN